MADAWGGSWGVAWGVSWGSGVTPPVVVPGGGSGYATRPWSYYYRDTLKEYARRLAKERREEEAERVAELERQIDEVEAQYETEQQQRSLSARREYDALHKGLEFLSRTIEQQKLVQKAEREAAIAKQIQEMLRQAKLAAIEAQRRDDEDAIIVMMMVH